MPDTTRTMPNAAEFAKRIEDLFHQITWESGNQVMLISMADDRCKADCNTPDDVGALIYSLEATKNNVYGIVAGNLRDTVKLLIERVKELEAQHV